MLVAGRKIGQSIIIGTGPNAIVVTYLGTNRHGQARLGITAPKEIVVDREEIAARRAAGELPPSKEPRP